MKDIQAIVYTSHAGHTKAFAELFYTMSDLPVYELEEAKKHLPKGSSIIFFGWIMASQVRGLRSAMKQFSVKAVCGVGMADPGTLVDTIRKTNPVKEDMQVFSLQGGFEMEKTHGIYRKMMEVMIKTVGGRLAKKTDKTPEDEQMLYLLTHDADKVSKEQLETVLFWYNN